MEENEINNKPETNHTTNSLEKKTSITSLKQVIIIDENNKEQLYVEMQPIKIYLMDGSYKVFKIKPETTSIEELWEIASEKFLLNIDSCQMFFIWGIAGDLELLLFTQQTVSSVFKDWVIYEKRYNPKEVQGIQKTLSKPKELIKKLSSTNLKNLRNSVDKNSDEIRLVLRTTSILPLKEERKFKDKEAIHLLYIQAVYNVINSNYPCDDDTAIKLGGIQLQITVGDQNPEIHKSGYLVDIISQYIPDHLLSKKKSVEWEELLLESHLKNKGKDIHELKIEYLEIVREWIYYGCVFFKAKYHSPDKVFFQQEFEGNIRIGVNEKGIHIIDPKEMKIISHKYEEIEGWDSNKDVFYYKLKDLSRNFKGKLTHFLKLKPIKSEIFYFKTKQAELINDLICDWMEEFEKEGDIKKEKKKSNRFSRHISHK